MGKPYLERANDALTNDRIRTADLETLHAEGIQRRDELTASVSQATADSVNYALSDADRAEADERATRAKRNATMFAKLVDDLAAKLTEKRESEAGKAKQAEIDAVVHRRDTLAELIRTTWPQAETTITSLLAKLQENDAELARIAPGEPSAEAVARNVPGNFYKGGIRIRRLTETKLPSLLALHNFAWPPLKPHPLALSNEHVRQSRLRLEEEQRREASRWARYVVTPPAEKRVAVETRRGIALLSRNSVIAELSQEFVEAARASGCSVELAKPGETMGGPQSAAYY